MIAGGRSPLFRKVTIVGVGLIGGSIGKAVRENRVAREVVGFSKRQSSLSNALKNGAIDKGSSDVKRAVSNADLVILSTPVKTIINMFSQINPHLKRGCIITDVGSTKGPIVEAAKKLSNPANFIGSHPLTGSEKKGVAFASAQLFQRSNCIITPTDKTSRQVQEKVRRFWSRLGATVKSMTPLEHDQVLASISHLPHLLAYALMEAVPKEHLLFASTGFKDTTRIAASTPEMWSDICLTNSTNLVKSLDKLAEVLGTLRRYIDFDNEKELVSFFKTSKEKRDGIK